MGGKGGGGGLCGKTNNQKRASAFSQQVFDTKILRALAAVESSTFQSFLGEAK